MKRFISYIAGIAPVLFIIGLVFAKPHYGPPLVFSTANLFLPVDSPLKDTLKFPFDDRFTDAYSNPFYDNSPLFMGDPSNINTVIEYDPTYHEYNIEEKIGDEFYRNPTYMTFDEFVTNEYRNTTKKYWRQRANEESVMQRKGLIPKIYIQSQAFDRIFGGNTIDIRPQGSAELTFGVNIRKNDNPAIPEKQRRNATFDFREKIQMSVIGNIGTKMKLGVNYNTEASFDFENKMKLEYTGEEDDIIRKIEAGNVTLPLTGTLIKGSQSLFGIKTQLQFGKLGVTTVFSQQKGKTSTINIAPGGAQKTDFDVEADDYESNKHFFLAQYFKDNYDAWLAQPPVIGSPVTITKLEVWVTNKPNSLNTRRMVAFMDLGENQPFNTGFVGDIAGFPGPGINANVPSDSANNLYDQMNTTYSAIRDYDQITATLQPLGSTFSAPTDYIANQSAVLLSPTEYTYNAKLGYVSLNYALNPEQVLAVAFEYSYNGRILRVGDLSTAGINAPQVLFLKMLKSNSPSPKITTAQGIATNPLWDLMMKNIYSLGGSQISREKFKLDVIYQDAATGSAINFLPVDQTEVNLSGIPLIKVLNLDRLNVQNDPQPDGVFDFVEGVTINTNTGRIIFPVREPFGNYLRSKFIAPLAANNFVFDELYDSTKTAAQQIAEKNKYRLKGSFQGTSSSEIPLNAINIPQGSVKISAGGIQLVENVDFTVDYNLGRVKIINPAYLNSATPLSITVESQSLFSIQSKTLIGTRFDYEFSKDFILGATFLHLNERPLTRKVNIGDEPISNTIWGFDGTYRTQSRFITRLIDRLPLIDTKDPSNVTVSGEFAQFLPGSPKAIGKTGTAYIDDFEGAETTIDLKNPGNWYLASVPQGQPSEFPEASLFDSLAYGFNRAKLAWYTIDPLFYRDNKPEHVNVDNDEISLHNTRIVLEQEIFPYKQSQTGQSTNIAVLNLAYYPGERGPYNYDVTASDYSAGINSSGNLLSPESRWGGIMRKIETTDFEQANIEYIQFWMMDPFHNENPFPGNTGNLYFNLGSVSEDILRDDKKGYEHGLPSVGNPASSVDTTSWGRVPGADLQSIVYAFDNDPASRALQDVGLDGCNNTDENKFFQQSYIAQVVAVHGAGSAAYQQAVADPSADDFHYFRGSDIENAGILDRYKNYNGPESNSKTTEQSPEAYSTASTTIPDAEDINKDNNMEVFENYYQYKVSLNPADMVIGKNFITDAVTRTVETQNEETKTITWYQFKIPVKSPTEKIGEINDFNSIRFIRMFMKDFENEIVLRFARLELLRGEWRKYGYDLACTGEILGTDPSVYFDVSSRSLEENGDRTPINYVLPPGIDREINPGSTNLQQLNERSLALTVCNLPDCQGKAAYKTLQYDLRSYKKLKMYIHAESYGEGDILRDNDLTVFIRIGPDFNSNFYEYEVPLTVTRWGTTDPEIIWPESNNMEIDLEKLINAKLARNTAIANNPNAALILKNGYSVADGKNTITVVGNPTISNVRTVLIGIRNPKGKYPGDDAASKCAEIWVNELRLTDFDREGGWAANARVTTQLASLGTLNLAGSRSTHGFGSLEQRHNETSKMDIISYDVSTQLELGKFIPEKAGITIPAYAGYSETFGNPQYNPLDPDVPFNTALNNETNEVKKDNIKKNSQDYTRRKSLNFTNVKKNKTKASLKSHIYDVENFNFTYAYSEIYKRDINTQFDFSKNVLGSVGYNFNTQPKPVQPFTKAKFAGSSKYMRLIKDFNFNYVPSSLNFRTDINRQYSEVLLRNNTEYLSIIDTTFNKSFQWTRVYGMNFDLTKSVKVDFNATNLSRIDEPEGRIDTEAKKDSIRQNFFDLGRTIDYVHNGNVSYNVPLNKFPLTDWVALNTKYGFDYHWLSAPLAYDSAKGSYGINKALGNTIQNANTKQVNATFTMNTLYNKVPFFKKITTPAPRGKAPAPKTPKVKDTKAASDTTQGKGKKKEEKKDRPINPVVKFLGKAVLGLKNISGTYSETNGTLLPGYLRRTELLGQEWNTSDLSKSAPGTGFIFGQQVSQFPLKAYRNGWITKDTLFNSQYTKTNVVTFNGRATIEPMDGFRIELNATRNITKNLSQNFKIINDEYSEFNQTQSGTFSISTITWGTAFVKDRKDYSNQVFDDFNKNREAISQILGERNPNSAGLTGSYYDGYGGEQQEVLTLAFLSAYTGKSPSTFRKDPTPFPEIPLPNWRVTYDGISKMQWAKKWFNNVTLSHGYRSSFNINAFTSNLLFADADGDGFTASRDVGNNFIAQYEIQQVSISEQFSPLFGVDVSFKNSLTTRFELKKDRSLSLTYAGIQLTEIKGNELVVGAGYRIKQFSVPFKIFGKKVKLNNNLNLAADVSIRKNNTIIRKMIEQTHQPTAGLTIVTIKTSADYVINERFNIRLFFDRTVNKPVVSTSFPTANTSAGIAIRFTLAP